VRIAIGCDHRGLELKKLVMKQLAAAGHIYEDMGCFTAESVDYPDIARKVAEAVARGDFERGILICDTGLGMSMAANKVNGIRATLCHNAFYATRARLHNDANILCLGAVEAGDQTPEIVKAFLTTGFEGGRHQRRLDKIKTMECQVG
jgi:ribose 5-phosphate isomerase B